MFITKTSLSRRTVLRGLGATLSLPLLEAMVPGNDVDGRRPRLHRPSDSAPSSCRWVSARVTGRRRRPASTSSSVRSSSRSKRSATQVVVVSNIDRPLQGTHAVSTGTWLTGCAPKRTEAEDFVAGTSLDQIIAGQDRRRHGVPVARDRHRRLHRIRGRVRRRIQLRLHEHDLVEDADHADADGDEPSRRLRAHVRAARIHRRARAAHGAEPQHPRLGEG